MKYFIPLLAIVLVGLAVPAAKACDIFSTSAFNVGVAVQNVAFVPSAVSVQRIQSFVPQSTIVPVAVQQFVPQTATIFGVQPVINTQVFGVNAFGVNAFNRGFAVNNFVVANRGFRSRSVVVNRGFGVNAFAVNAFGFGGVNVVAVNRGFRSRNVVINRGFGVRSRSVVRIR